MTTPSIVTDNYRRKGISDLLSLKGKTVVVTGGARGLGLTFAWGAAEVGASIAVLDRLDKPHDDFYLLEKELGVKTKFYKVDVTSYESLEDVFGQVKKDFGTIDHCITAAGIPTDKPFFEHTPADMRALMGVNVEGSFSTAQIAAKHMVDQGTGGSIVMIASIAAHASVPGKTLSGYCFSKGAILAGARALAIELAEHNIRVNTISPGFILTDMSVQNIAKRPNILNEIPRYVPMKRWGDRGDLKSAMVMLLSDASAYTTGSDLLIDGGLMAS